MRLDSACVCYDGGGRVLYPSLSLPVLLAARLFSVPFWPRGLFLAGTFYDPVHSSTFVGHCGNPYGSRRFDLQCHLGTFICARTCFMVYLS